MPTLTPAYGRDYASAKEAKADYLAGKDFVFADMFGGRTGAQCSKVDFPGQQVTIRFKRLRSTTNVTAPR